MDPLAALDDLEDMSDEDIEDYELRMQSQMTTTASSQSSAFSSSTAGLSSSTRHFHPSTRKGNTSLVQPASNTHNRSIISSEHHRGGAVENAPAKLSAPKMGHVEVSPPSVKAIISPVPTPPLKTSNGSTMPLNVSIDHEKGIHSSLGSPESLSKTEFIDVDALPEVTHQKLSPLRPIQPLPSSKIPAKSEHARSMAKTKAAKPKEDSKRKGSEVPPKEKKLTKKAMQALIKERAEREKKMSHKEYIETLPDKWPNREKEYSQFLLGAVILFAERMWEKRAAVRDKLDRLYKHGAELVTAYDAEHVTHIVSAGASWETVKLINDNIGIPIHTIPLRIKIVKWQWVSDCEARKGLVEPTMDRYIHHDRWMRDIHGGGSHQSSSTALVPKRKRREITPILDSEDEEKARYQYPIKRHKPEGGPKSHYRGLMPVGSSGVPESIAPKTATVSTVSPRAAIEIGSDEEVEEQPGIRFEAFQCMQVPDGQPKDCPNQDVVDTLEELRLIYASRVDEHTKWKALALTKAISRLRKHPKRFESMQELVAIPGIGVKTAQKIMEVITTHGLRRLDYERTGETAAVLAFQGIYGVGPQLAATWYTQGLRSLEDVRRRKNGLKLTPAQEIGLTYYEDLQSRMPRQEAKDIFDQVSSAAWSIDPDLMIELMGSYRRGKETCGDIDILITRDPADGKDHSGLLPCLLDKLHESGLLIADLAGEKSGGLEAKYMGICRRAPGDKARRIDILCVPFIQWGASLIYFTGDDIFNRSMRLLARKKYMVLNQHGLWDQVVRDIHTAEKLCIGSLIASRTEKEVFEALGVPWQEPHQRNRT